MEPSNHSQFVTPAPYPVRGKLRRESSDVESGRIRAGVYPDENRGRNDIFRGSFISKPLGGSINLSKSDEGFLTNAHAVFTDTNTESSPRLHTGVYDPESGQNLTIINKIGHAILSAYPFNLSYKSIILNNYDEVRLH
jgi:hypothetical protein